MKPQIIIIVAHDNKRGIGARNQLLWRLPEDLKRFKKLTLNHPVIMGRKTFESIGRPLPQRTNIIITRQSDYSAPGCLMANSLKQALAKAVKLDNQAVFIIGGGQIYCQALPLADKLYITHVKGDFKADTFFPDYSQFNKLNYKKESHYSNINFTFYEYSK